MTLLAVGLERTVRRRENRRLVSGTGFTADARLCALLERLDGAQRRSARARSPAAAASTASRPRPKTSVAALRNS